MTSPDVARISPETQSSKLDLPHPEGPTMDTNSPAAIEKLSGPKACVSGWPARR
jgi:hypothetical protein